MSPLPLITSYSSFVLASHCNVSNNIRYSETAFFSSLPPPPVTSTASYSELLPEHVNYSLNYYALHPFLLRILLYLTPLILCCFCVPEEGEIDRLLNYSTSMTMHGEVEVGTTPPLGVVCPCYLSCSYSSTFRIPLCTLSC